MRIEHHIAMDTHCQTTEICVKTRANTPGPTWQVPTTIPALREAIESVRRPRSLAFEEGPLASWLCRNLKADVDRLIVCDPRKNAWIAKGGDKDDPIDAGKLADLFIGGFVKPVHHSTDLAREAFKQLVGLYHERVGHRVMQANKVIGRFRRRSRAVPRVALAGDQTRQARCMNGRAATLELCPIDLHGPPIPGESPIGAWATPAVRPIRQCRGSGQWSERWPTQMRRSSGDQEAADRPGKTFA